MRLPNKTEITIGAPINAVTELIGNAPSNPGIRATKLQNRAREAPVRVTAGINIRWSDETKIVLHK